MSMAGNDRAIQTFLDARVKSPRTGPAHDSVKHLSASAD